MKVFYCSECRFVYAIQGEAITAGMARCRCNAPHCLRWVRDDDPEVIARHIGVPVEEWDVLAQ